MTAKVAIKGANGLSLIVYTEEEIFETKKDLMIEAVWMIKDKLKEEVPEERWRVFKKWGRNLSRVGVKTALTKKDVLEWTLHAVGEMIETMDNCGWIPVLLEGVQFPLKTEPLAEGEDPDNVTASDILSGLTPPEAGNLETVTAAEPTTYDDDE